MVDIQKNLGAIEQSLAVMERTEENRFPKMEMDDLLIKLGFEGPLNDEAESRAMAILDRINLLAEKTQQDPSEVLEDLIKSSSLESRLPAGYSVPEEEEDLIERAKPFPEDNPEE